MANMRIGMSTQEKLLVNISKQLDRLIKVSGNMVRQSINLPLPDSFPVTLKRNYTEYYIEETGDDFLEQFTGDSIYISETGNDTTGNGTEGLPYRSLNKAILESTSLGRIMIGGGQYSSPSSAISKSLAFIASSDSEVYIGSFYSLSGSTITPATGNIFTVSQPVVGFPFTGLIRTDGIRTGGVAASSRAQNTTIVRSMQTLGLSCLCVVGSSTNMGLGTLENLSTIVSENKIIGWTGSNSTSVQIASGNTVYFGPNITIANNSTQAFSCLGSANAILDRCSVFGGIDACIYHGGTGYIVSIDINVSGSFGDLIDYSGASIGVEKNIVAVWASSDDAANNTSTCHVNARVLRVGCTYRGGSRTIHDINNSKSYVFSCSIGDPLFFDKTCLMTGFSTMPTESPYLAYGDITFLNTFNQAGITNLSVQGAAVAVNTELNDPWPYS